MCLHLYWAKGHQIKKIKKEHIMVFVLLLFLRQFGSDQVIILDNFRFSGDWYPQQYDVYIMEDESNARLIIILGETIQGKVNLEVYFTK